MVSATDDPFLHDADHVVAAAQARRVYPGCVARIDHNRYEGDHAVTRECFNDIVRWLGQCAD